VRKGGRGDGSLIFVNASGSGYLRPRNQRSFGSVYVTGVHSRMDVLSGSKNRRVSFENGCA
jgi:hypothetical protein